MATVLKSTYNDTVSVVDLESITASEYKEIKRHCGLKMGEFEMSLGKIADDGIEIEVMDCFYWLFLKRSGKSLPIEAVPDYSPLKFLESLELVPDAGEPQADPLGVSPSI